MNHQSHQIVYTFFEMMRMHNKQLFVNWVLINSAANYGTLLCTIRGKIGSFFSHNLCSSTARKKLKELATYDSFLLKTKETLRLIKFSTAVFDNSQLFTNLKF